MKTPLLFLVTAAILSCGYPPIPDSYQVKFPVPPAFRTELLGECHWRLEYHDSTGNFRQKEVGSNAGISIDVLQQWPNAILAWPYWPEGEGSPPEKALPPGLFYPAGAIFPLDAAGETIILSWETGAEAYFYRELDKAGELNAETNKKPEYFDWKRFRSLLWEHENPELRKDPWLADWKDIAEKTVRSGFRQSYIRPKDRIRVEIIIPHAGPWLSASPFAPPEFWEAGETHTFLLTPYPEIFICPGGRLSISSQVSLWVPFP